MPEPLPAPPPEPPKPAKPEEEERKEREGKRPEFDSELPGPFAYPPLVEEED